MHCGSEVLRLCHVRKQGPELVALIGGEPGGELAVVFARDGPETGHEFLAARGEVEGVEPPVGVVALPGEVAAGLEFVDEGDDPAGQQVEALGQFLLAQAGLSGDEAHDARERPCEVQWGE